MMLAQPAPAVARSVMKVKNPLEGAPYVRSEWRQIKVPPRAQAEYRAQETYPRIAGNRDQDEEVAANECSRFCEANRRTGMNSRVPFSANAGAQHLLREEMQ
jgi:hypothetical protein